MNRLIIFDATINEEPKRLSVEVKPEDSFDVQVVLLKGGTTIVKEVSTEEVLKNIPGATIGVSRRVKQVYEGKTTYSVAIQPGERWSSLTTGKNSHTELIIADLALTDIEKAGYDLLKIVNEERK